MATIYRDNSHPYNLAPHVYNVYDLASLYLDTAGLPNTPITQRMLAAWFWAESGHSGQYGVNVYNNNPLNITTSGSDYHGFSGNTLKFANYATPQEGAQAWAQLLRSNSRYNGIIKAFQSQDYAGFGAVVGRSPWGTAGGTIQNAFWYFQHLPIVSTGSLGAGPGEGSGNYGSGGYGVWFGNYSNQSNPILETFPVGTPITADFIKALAQDLYDKGAFGATQNQGDFNPVDINTANTAKNNFIIAMDQAVGGKTWGPNVNAPLAKYINAAAQAAGAAGNPGSLLPDLSGLTALGNLANQVNSSNLAHAAAVPAGFVMVLFGLRLLLAGAGVTTGGQGGGTTVVQPVRQYPMIIRR